MSDFSNIPVENKIGWASPCLVQDAKPSPSSLVEVQGIPLAALSACEPPNLNQRRDEWEERTSSKRKDGLLGAESEDRGNVQTPKFGVETCGGCQ